MPEEQPQTTEQTTSETQTQETQEKTEQSLEVPKPIVGGETETKPEETTEQNSGEAKSEETEKKPEARAPEEYEAFTLPEGMTMDEAQTAEFKSFAKEQDLTQEQAQKVLEYGGTKIKALLDEAATAPYKTWKETQEKWQADVKADTEIGGTKLEDSVKAAGLVFEPGEGNPFLKTAVEAQALRDALNATGAGNNPAVVKLFVRLGKILAEPGPLTGKPPVIDKQGDLLAKMYPTMSEESR